MLLLRVFGKDCVLAGRGNDFEISKGLLFVQFSVDLIVIFEV